MKFTQIVLIALILISCRMSPENPSLQPGEGLIEVEGGSLWYGIIGEGNNTPVLCLHGGPGGTSRSYYYMSEVSQDRPMILFDQLGGGKSTNHNDTSLLKVENFVEQVQAVKNHLGLKELYVLGSSWGAALALEYYQKYPEGIKGIIFASPYVGTPTWAADADTLISFLPDSIQKSIEIAEATGDYESEEYQEANTYFLSQYGYRNRSTFQRHPYDSVDAPGNGFIYNYMWGPSEFTATGTLKDYDNLQSLSEVTIPALFITGEFDEARLSTVERMSKLTPNSTFIIVEGAGHSMMLDNKEQLVSEIRKTLMQYDSK